MQITRKLEALNPTKSPLKSELLNGKWELIYTTSVSILQTTVCLAFYCASFSYLLNYIRLGFKQSVLFDLLNCYANWPSYNIVHVNFSHRWDTIIKGILYKAKLDILRVLMRRLEFLGFFWLSSETLEYWDLCPIQVVHVSL